MDNAESNAPITCRNTSSEALGSRSSAACDTGLQQVAEFRRRHRAAEIVALALGTAILLQHCKLLSRFHSFGHDPHMQIVPHTNHGSDNTGVVLIGRKVTHEGPIDLQSVDRKALQRAQTRIPSAEVIQRKQHTDFLQFPEHVCSRSRILDEGGFGQFKFEAVRWQPRLCQNVAYARRETRAAQLHRGNIYGYGHRRQARSLPDLRLAASFAHYPAADWYDEAAL